jgi:hypothetical protein
MVQRVDTFDTQNRPNIKSSLACAHKQMEHKLNKTIMKTLKWIPMIILGVALTIQMAHGQNYKAPTIDASGKITNEKGQFIGTVTKEGTISDATGTKVAYVDSQGTMVDAKTGKKIGKADKNGIFIPYFKETKDKGWTVSTPMNGTCLVKDSAGKLKAEVHENYKEFGACAIHCLTTPMTMEHH